VIPSVIKIVIFIYDSVQLSYEIAIEALLLEISTILKYSSHNSNEYHYQIWNSYEIRTKSLPLFDSRE
jgi:hypothetical protein